MLTENPGRLLVVDDDLARENNLSSKLSNGGYSVDVAGGAPEALDKIFRDQYDVVLLDQMTRGIGSMDLLRLLRATYSPSELPVIVITPVDQNQTIMHALDQGANDYVLKPVEMPAITSRIQAQLYLSNAHRKIRESERLYRIAERGSRDGLWIWDPESANAYFSPRWASILGYHADEIGSHQDAWLGRLHPDDDTRVREEMRAHLERSTPEFRSEHRLRQKNGQYRWVLCRGVALRSSDGAPVRVAGSLADMGNTKACDPLTGLSERMTLLDRIASGIARKDGPGIAQVAVLLFDLDGFKAVNDGFGHAAGDHLLGEVATRLCGAVAAKGFERTATVGRLNGDEFAIVLDHPKDRDEVTAFAGEVLECLRPPVHIYGVPVSTTASAGIVFGQAAASPNQLLHDANLAMYRAKELGKNRWHLFDPGMRVCAQTRMATAIDLRYAVERNELLAVYQPKVNLRTRTIAGFEALLRWRHPERGLLHPGDFIPVAEETGLIIQAGEWILETACYQLKTWQKLFPMDPPLSMSVNLSVKQLNAPQLVSSIRAILTETQIPPETLKLELTESSLIAEIQSARCVLSEIQAMGVGIKLDDFGTGYSSLSYLSTMHFDSLKIDKSFVDRLATDADSQAIVRTIVNLASALNMGIVAEGIETESQLERLINLGCEVGQGYLFSKPVEAEAAEQLLRDCFGISAAA